MLSLTKIAASFVCTVGLGLTRGEGHSKNYVVSLPAIDPSCPCLGMTSIATRKSTSLDLFLRRTNFPSKSTSSTATRPLVLACWEKLVRRSPSSSFLFLEEPGVVEWLTWILEPRFWELGLGDSLSLGREREGVSAGWAAAWTLEGTGSDPGPVRSPRGDKISWLLGDLQTEATTPWDVP